MSKEKIKDLKKINHWSKEERISAMSSINTNKIGDIIHQNIESLKDYNNRVSKFLNQNKWNKVDKVIDEKKGLVSVTYSNNKVNVTGKAKCRPEDRFIPEVGLAIAHEKVFKMIML